MEWEDLTEAIRKDLPYNEVKRGAEASLVSSMGRMAAHTGQVITFDQILNSDHEFAPEVDQLSINSPAPLQLEKSGRYPIPMPGINKKASSPEFVGELNIENGGEAVFSGFFGPLRG